MQANKIFNLLSTLSISCVLTLVILNVYHNTFHDSYYHSIMARELHRRNFIQSPNKYSQTMTFRKRNKPNYQDLSHQIEKPGSASDVYASVKERGEFQKQHELYDQLPHIEELVQKDSAESTPKKEAQPLPKIPKKKKEPLPITVESKKSDLAGLSCSNFGGPMEQKAVDEMVYWNDIPSDSKYTSPFASSEQKYLTFEPDNGGWNNIRMSMETILVLAHATGRTLVLPPPQKFYLLQNGQEKNSFSFEDFFHMDRIGQEHAGLNIITMKDFLNNVIEANKIPNIPKPPPQQNKLWQYLREIGTFPDTWQPWECLVTIPSSSSTQDLQTLKSYEADLSKVSINDYVGKPVRIDASTKTRLMENLAERRSLCLYNTTLQNTPLIHVYEKTDNTRFLAPFYSFLFFQDWKQDLFFKRFVRDHVRYIDEIMCASARIIQELRKRIKKQTQLKKDWYDATHVRRGDFQYLVTRLDAPILLNFSKSYFDKDSIVYIATDERDLSFFQPFRDYYANVFFLKDFVHLIPDVNVNYYGMIDQLICTKSRHFIGTWWSTFSAYINRMRGYHVNKNKLEGYEDGLVKSWYYNPDMPGIDRVNEMRVYWPIRKPLYMREFPTSWRNIDHGFDVTDKQ